MQIQKKEFKNNSTSDTCQLYEIDKNNTAFANFNMNSNATFAMTHFLKLYYNVFILENKIDAPMLKKFVSICVIPHWKLC